MGRRPSGGPYLGCHTHPGTTECEWLRKMKPSPIMAVANSLMHLCCVDCIYSQLPNGKTMFLYCPTKGSLGTCRCADRDAKDSISGQAKQWTNYDQCCA